MREEELRMLRGEKELADPLSSSNLSSDLSLKSKRPSGINDDAMQKTNISNITFRSWQAHARVRFRFG
jgi:hypothetical protein